jgi:hypothetical protein
LDGYRAGKDAFTWRTGLEAFAGVFHVLALREALYLNQATFIPLLWQYQYLVTPMLAASEIESSRATNRAHPVEAGAVKDAFNMSPQLSSRHSPPIWTRGCAILLNVDRDRSSA